MGILDLLGVGLGVFLLFVLGVVIFCVCGNKSAYYTPAECSICKNMTGIKGNKRFKFIDGFVCESCLKAANKNPENIE